jgi:DNA-directed RNA polymerase specialized sigma24 family protein
VVSKTTRTIGIAAVVIAVALVGGGALVFAQGGGPTDQPNPHGQGIFDRDAIKEAIAGALGITVDELEAAREEGKRIDELAEELGVDLADVEAAVQAAREEMVQQAVEDGTITQEQADQILSGEFRGGRDGRGGHGGGPGVIDRDVIKEAIAGALGITVEELEAAHEEGKNLAELAEELGVDLADVEAAVQAAVEEMVQQAVEDGTITQEQADQILSGDFHGGRGGGPHPNGGGRGSSGGFPGGGPNNDA